MNKSGKSQGLKDVARALVKMSLQLAFVSSLSLQKWFSKWQSHPFKKCLVEKIPGILHHDFNFDSVSNMSMKFYISVKKYRLEGEEINCLASKRRKTCISTA